MSNNRSTKDIIRLFDRKFHIIKLDVFKLFYRLRHPTPTYKQILFVLGFQRSGTTMLVDVLNESPEVDVYHESDKRAFASFQLRSKDVIDPLISTSTAHCTVFKPICDSHRALDLLGDYEGSKGIWIYRNYRDVTNSAVIFWGNHAIQVIGDAVAGKMSWGWRQEAISQDTLTRIKEVWRPDISPHEAFALFWYQRNQIFFDLELSKNPRMFLVRYENLVTKQDQFFPKLFEFIGLPISKDLNFHVSATSIGKQEFPEASVNISAMCDEMLGRLDRAAAM